MGTISLLHIGDIHYSHDEIHHFPANPRNMGQYDWSELSSTEKANLVQFLARQIKKSLFHLIETEHFEAVILTGDLCRRGNLEGYRECLEYLKLQFHNFSKKISQSQLKISAGNHDLCSNFDYDPDNLKKRFIPFCNLLTQNRFSDFSTDTIIPENLNTPFGKILLININSCLEFGNITHLSGPRQKAIRLEIENAGADVNLNYILNIPFINEEILNSVCQVIEDNPDSLPIIFTHHNFSHIGRFNPAREHDHILNAGTVCDRLETLDRPILIFHGHIHSYDCDVMEKRNVKMIFLSAPLFFPQLSREADEMYGYNIVKIKFAEDELHTPLGCDIISLTLNGCELTNEKERFFFHDPLSMAKSLNETERAIYHRISANPNKMFLDELFESLRNTGEISNNLIFRQFFSTVTDLYWRTLIEFKANNDYPERSKVWRKIP